MQTDQQEVLDGVYECLIRMVNTRAENPADPKQVASAFETLNSGVKGLAFVMTEILNGDVAEARHQLRCTREVLGAGEG